MLCKSLKSLVYFRWPWECMDRFVYLPFPALFWCWFMREECHVWGSDVRQLIFSPPQEGLPLGSRKDFNTFQKLTLEASLRLYPLFPLPSFHPFTSHLLCSRILAFLFIYFDFLYYLVAVIMPLDRFCVFFCAFS